MINDSGLSTGKIMPVPPMITYNQMLNGSKIGCLTVILDLEKIDKPMFEDIGHEDYLLWLELEQVGIMYVSS